MQFFGTDGIRGVAGQGAIKIDFCMQLVESVCGFLQENNKIKHKRIAIAKDTRQSCDFLEHAISACFAQNGFNVDLTSTIPSPALSLVAKLGDYDLGVVISASHNPSQYNGIKFFDTNGSKLTIEDEEAIEKKILEKYKFENKTAEFGFIKNIEEQARKTYADYVLKEFNSLNWDSFPFKVILDMANGASYQVADAIFSNLFGKDNVVKIGNNPDGLNINKGCGSTDLSLLRKHIKEHENAIGIAFDGDADRVIMVDQEGNEINGDILIGIIGESLHKSNRLNKDTIILTQMSNLGVIESLNERNIKVEIVDVGDRNISNKMHTDGLNFGGEQSGHIIVKDFTPSGDGIVSSLFVLKEILLQNKAINEFKKDYQEYFQSLTGIRVTEEEKRKIDLEKPQKLGNEILKNKGRVVLRKSGTEPLIRILIEAKTLADVDFARGEVEKAIEK